MCGVLDFGHYSLLKEACPCTTSDLIVCQSNLYTLPGQLSNFSYFLVSVSGEAVAGISIATFFGGLIAGFFIGCVSMALIKKVSYTLQQLYYSGNILYLNIAYMQHNMPLISTLSIVLYPSFHTVLIYMQEE